MQKYFLVKVSQKHFIWFWKQNHCTWLVSTSHLVASWSVSSPYSWPKDRKEKQGLHLCWISNECAVFASKAYVLSLAATQRGGLMSVNMFPSANQWNYRHFGSKRTTSTCISVHERRYTAILTTVYCMTSKYSNSFQLHRHIAGPNDVLWFNRRLHLKHLALAHTVA